MFGARDHHEHRPVERRHLQDTDARTGDQSDRSETRTT